MTVLVCGGRDFDDYTALADLLNSVHLGVAPITKVVSGAADGADSLGEYWAVQHDVPVARYPANWKMYGKRAGMIRNAQMLEAEAIELVVACKGGRGTADMVRRSLEAHKPVMRVGW